MLTFCQISFQFLFDLIIFREQLRNRLLSVDFFHIKASGLLYKELETTGMFFTIVEFLWTYFIYFIYIICEKKN